MAITSVAITSVAITSVALLVINLDYFSLHVYNTRARWRNGLARLQQWLCYLQGPGFESHLRPVKFFAGNYGFFTQQSNSNANIFAMRPNYLARGYQGLHVIKQANKTNRNKHYLQRCKWTSSVNL